MTPWTLIGLKRMDKSLFKVIYMAYIKLNPGIGYENQLYAL